MFTELIFFPSEMCFVYILQVEFSNPVAQKKTVFDYQLGAVGSVEQAFSFVFPVFPSLVYFCLKTRNAFY